MNEMRIVSRFSLVYSRRSGIYQVGVLLQDAEEFAGRAIRGADALFPVPDGGKGEPQSSGKFALAQP